MSSTCDHFPVFPLVILYPGLLVLPLARTLSVKWQKECVATEARIEGNKTNHSLRAYATSKLFQAGIQEKVIQDSANHKSLDGLRKYETISEEQKQEACQVLATCGSDQEIGNVGTGIPNSVPGLSHGVFPMAYQQSNSLGLNIIIVHNSSSNLQQHSAGLISVAVLSMCCRHQQ